MDDGQDKGARKLRVFEMLDGMGRMPINRTDEDCLSEPLIQINPMQALDLRPR